MAGKPIVAIVGRPNVGKSALFNRIAGSRIAIVDDAPGVTRDRIYANCRWLDREFVLIDTGGIDVQAADSIAVQVRRQAEMAIEAADVMIFVVDGRTGLVGADEEVARLLRRCGKPVLVAVNKIDEPSPELQAQVYEFMRLGLGDPIPISAEHGRNIGDLLTLVIQRFPPPDETEDDDAIKVAIIGRPNVGKSSLVNALVGEERVIVSEVPGTTRDAVDIPFTHQGRSFLLIDTAGMRRRKRVKDPVEYYSVVRAVRAVERSDVALVMLDATELVTEQDKKVAGIPHEAGKGVVIVVNKWDAVEKDAQTMKRMEERVRTELAFLPYAPIIFISALTGRRVADVLDLVEMVANNHAHRIPTGRLNEWLKEAILRRQPPSVKGKQGRIYYAHQVSVKPPHFVFHVNDKDLFHFSYLRYLENELRERFGFQGTPVRFTLRSRGEEGR